MPSRFFLGERHRVPGDVITWIGVCPWQDTASFGTDAGRFIVTRSVKPKHGRKASRDSMGITAVHEPVNGAAFLKDYAVVTSRSEVLVAKRGTHIDVEEGRRKRKVHAKSFPYGGHNAIALPRQGVFLVAADADGVAILKPDEERVRQALISTETALRFFHLVRVGPHPGGEVIAAACRDAGVLGAVFHADTMPESPIVHGFPGSDIVMVRRAGRPDLPRAVVALSSDGTLFFIPDVLAKRQPSFITPTADLGEAYSFLVIGDSGFVLTPDRLVCLPRMLAGGSASRPFHPDVEKAFSIQVEASDLLSYRRDGFAILKEQEALTFDATEFIRSAIFPRRVIRGTRHTRNRAAQSIGLSWDVEQDDYEPSQSPWEPREGLPLDRSREEEESFVLV